MKVIGFSHQKQYKLEKVIGKGTYGKVYECLPYAIKEIDTENMGQKLRECVRFEMNLLKNIRHPNIVNLYDGFTQGKYVYLVMEYCPQDLDTYLRNHKVSEKEAISIFKQILQGFKPLVSQGIIHRDLKPANILVNQKKEFKLADFGLAKMVNNFENQMLYSAVGTPIYMAPQILQTTLGINNGSYTTKCDIWSLGIIFYEILTGATPWYAQSIHKLYSDLQRQKLRIPIIYSEWTKQILRRMLVIDEAKRIGWDQLFKYVFIEERNILKAPRKTSLRQKCFSKENLKTENEIHQNEQRKRILSAKKVQNNQIKNDYQQKPGKEPLIIECSHRIIVEIFQLQLQLIFGEEKSKKIIQKKMSLSNQDCEKIKKIIGYFNEDYQRSLKNLLPFLFNH